LIIDWNIHMFSRDIQRYPFYPTATYIPTQAMQSEDPLGDYIAHMDREGIDRAVLVHPEPYGDDHRLVLHCLQKEPTRFVAASLFFPKDSDAPDKLADLVRQEPRIIALRFHAHRGKESYLDSFADEGVRNLWAMAARLGLIVELHIGPNYAGQTTELIAAHPDTPVIIDHLAEPHMGNAVEYANVLELSRYGNVYMKLSGLNHIATDAPLFESAKLFTRWVAGAFGPDHLVWGGGTPAVVDSHLDYWTEAEREKVKGGNLAQLIPFFQ
jgi:predicted TIM-barrel fold metal-dependent hydrolase